MASYVVMEPQGREGGDAVLLRDGFSWLAFLLPPLWLLWHRLWIEALLAFVVLGLLSALGERAGFGLAGAAGSLLVALFVGLEGQALRIAALRRRGWRESGVVEAGRLAEGEIRHAVALEAEQPPAAPPRIVPSSVPDPSRSRPVAAGLMLGMPHRSGRP